MSPPSRDASPTSSLLIFILMSVPAVPSFRVCRQIDFLLIQRLLDGGVSESQDSDTLYMPQPNPAAAPLPLAVLADSTRATLAAALTGHRPNGGPAVSLSAGTPLTLPDGTAVNAAIGTLVAHPDGTTSKLTAVASVQLPGSLPVSSSSGIQWKITTGD